MPKMIWSGLVLMALCLTGCADRIGDPMAGRQIYFQKTLGSRQAPGCITCHSLDPEEAKVGPSHSQAGSRAAERVAADDYSGQAEDAAGYLRESILEPEAHVVAGYDPGVMYQNYDEVLTEEQVSDLVAFLLSLQ